MSTQFARVQIGPTEYLAQPSSQMLGVSRTSLSSKYLRQNRVSEAAPVLRIGQTAKRISAPEMLEDGWFTH